MIVFTAEIEYSDGVVLELVSFSLLKCIDHINRHERFPSVGNNVIFSVWENESRISKAVICGYRSSALTSLKEDRKFTYEEVMKKLCFS